MNELSDMLTEHELKGSELELRKLKTFCISHRLKPVLILQPDNKGEYSWYLTIFKGRKPIIDLQRQLLTDLFKDVNILTKKLDFRNEVALKKRC